MGLYIYIRDKDGNELEGDKFCGFGNTMGIGERDLSHLHCEDCSYAPRNLDSRICQECFDYPIIYTIDRTSLVELEQKMDSNKTLVRELMDERGIDLVKIEYDF